MTGQGRADQEADVEASFQRAVRNAAVAAVAMATGAAFGADMPRRAPYTAPAPISSYSWTGPYLGGNLGAHWGSTTHDPTQPSGIAGGVQGGYNWQTGQFVFGLEADLNGSSARDTFAPWKFSNPWFGTLRGRAGILLDRVMLYGTLGFAAGGGEAEVTGATERRTHAGWATGAGAEFGLTPNVSARVEYLFIDLADRPYPITGASHGFESSLLRFGLNYRF